MSRESRMLAGVILVTLPSVMFGGLTLLHLLTRHVPGYLDNPMRQNLWRAGHAHAGVYLLLSLIALRYVDETLLSPAWRCVARLGAPVAAILIPAAFFLSGLSPQATEPNGLIYLAYPGALSLALAVLTLGVGLIRAARAGGPGNKPDAEEPEDRGARRALVSGVRPRAAGGGWLRGRRAPRRNYKPARGRRAWRKATAGRSSSTFRSATSTGPRASSRSSASRSTRSSPTTRPPAWW